MTSSAEPLAARYDVALLDLDGVVYIGQDPVAHAVPALHDARSLGMRLGYVTNNAARTPAVVATHLSSFGLDVLATDVVTSAQAAARVLVELVGVGKPVFVLGGPGLRSAVLEYGLTVGSVADATALIQGFSPDISWHDLADGAAVLQRDVPWVASNMDFTFPTPRGLAPGNGSFVQVLEHVTSKKPVVAGKPQPALMQESVARLAAQHPLVVGDRLDTDIEGANRSGLDSLLVLTGVTQPADLADLDPIYRPTWVAPDLRGLTSGPVWSLEQFLAGSV